MSEGELDGNQYPYPWEGEIAKGNAKCDLCGGEVESENIARCNACKQKIEPARIKSTSWEANKQRIMDGLLRLAQQDRNELADVKSALF